jgi:hypothetical protein
MPVGVQLADVLQLPVAAFQSRDAARAGTATCATASAAAAAAERSRRRGGDDDGDDDVSADRVRRCGCMACSPLGVVKSDAYQLRETAARADIESFVYDDPE